MHEGASLTLLDMTTAPSKDELLRIANEIAEAITHLHEAVDPPLLHLDLTPYNVMVTDEGRCVIIDLGRPTGKPRSHHYAPIELYQSDNGMQPDHRADQYLLGTLLFSIACGAPASAIILSESDNPIVVPAPERWSYEKEGRAGPRQLPLRRFRSDIPASFCAWVERLMQVDPKDRFTSDREMLDALQAALKDASQEPPSNVNPRDSLSRPKPWWMRLVPSNRRRRGFVILWSLLITACLLTLTYPLVLVAIGQGLLHLGRPGAALGVFGYLPELSDRAHLHRARALSSLGREEDAWSELQRAQSLNRHNRLVQIEITSLASRLIARWTREGQEALAEGDYDAAAARYQKVVNVSPRLPDAWMQLGRIAIRKRKPSLASGYYRKAVSERPDSVDGHLSIAMLSADLADANAAFWHCTRAVELHQKPFPVDDVSDRVCNDVRRRVAALCAKVALLARSRGSQLDEQLLWLKRAVGLDPKSPLRHFQYGDSLIQAGLYSSALLHFKRCYELQPQFPEVVDRIATCYFRMRLKSEAFKWKARKRTARMR